jgi:hypothetical protein
LPAPVLPGSVDEAALGATEPFEDVPDRRNVRAGDDRELAGGSAISHANAAAETDGGSAGALGVLDDERPDGAVLEGLVLEGAVREASSPDGFTPDAAGSAAAVAGRVGADGGVPKLNTGAASAGD